MEHSKDNWNSWNTVNTPGGKKATQLPRTEDGYYLYLLENGDIVDSLDGVVINVGFNNIIEAYPFLTEKPSVLSRLSDSEIDTLLEIGFDELNESEVAEVKAEARKRLNQVFSH